MTDSNASDQVDETEMIQPPRHRYPRLLIGVVVLLWCACDQRGRVGSYGDNETADMGSRDATADTNTSDATADMNTPDANVIPTPVDGCALRLPNYAARARVDYDPALYPSTFTYEAWASFDSFAVTDPAQVIFTASQIGFRLVYMQAYRGNIDCVMGTGSSDPRVSYSILSAGILPGTFHHYACTHDESALTLWIDGVPVASRSGAGYQPPTTSPLGIGGNGYPNGSGFGGERPDHDIIGSIDEFRVSNTVVYTERFTPARELDVRPDTVALWRFNECSGTTSRNEVDENTLALTFDNEAAWVETR